MRYQKHYSTDNSTTNKETESTINLKYLTCMILQIIDGVLICLPLPTTRQEEECCPSKKLAKVPADLMERKLNMMAQDTLCRTRFIMVVVMYNSLGTRTTK